MVGLLSKMIVLAFDNATPGLKLLCIIAILSTQKSIDILKKRQDGLH